MTLVSILFEQNVFGKTQDSSITVTSTFTKPHSDFCPVGETDCIPWRRVRPPPTQKKKGFLGMTINRI